LTLNCQYSRFGARRQVRGILSPVKTKPFR
jgi:hypothetical protein